MKFNGRLGQRARNKSLFLCTSRKCCVRWEIFTSEYKNLIYVKLQVVVTCLMFLIKKIYLPDCFWWCYHRFQLFMLKICLYYKLNSDILEILEPCTALTVPSKCNLQIFFSHCQIDITDTSKYIQNGLYRVSCLMHTFTLAVAI